MEAKVDHEVKNSFPNPFNEKFNVGPLKLKGQFLILDQKMLFEYHKRVFLKLIKVKLTFFCTENNNVQH